MAIDKAAVVAIVDSAKVQIEALPDVDVGGQVAELQAQVAALSAQVAQLQAQVDAVQAKVQQAIQVLQG
ncbi:MAG TPA: hypothetical protein PKW79_00300 [Rhabdochlamydiaceae bacterium]|nr:hypothetical protein [Rhabdochlamydiaceae bacterium]